VLPGKYDESSINTLSGASLKTDQNVYSTDTVEISLTFDNNSGRDLGYGEYFEVQIYKGETWMTIPFKKSHVVHDIAILWPSGKAQKAKCDLTDLNYKIKPGRYRIVWEIFDPNGQGQSNLTAEFKVE
jgi:hypothetical protein